MENSIKTQLLVNGEQYFSDLYHEILKAKQSIYILGWDWDWRTSLLRGSEEEKKKSRIFNIIQEITNKNSKLDVRMIIWNHPLFYQKDRELLSGLKAKFISSKNLKFKRDDIHPLMASHHEKLVIIDNNISYIGGIDLTSARWDDFYNSYDNPKRRDPHDEPYPPFRDFTLKLNGEISKLCYNHFVWRWNLLPDIQEMSAVDFQRSTLSSEDRTFHLVKTIPKMPNTPPSVDSLKIHLDVIQEAKKYIYIENQYFTSESITEALVSKLKEKNGPEIIMLLSDTTMDLLEKKTMGVLTQLRIQKLLKNDLYKRLGIFTLLTGSKEKTTAVKIHSKTLLVDDQWFKVGSSNLNGRSMGMDTELDVFIKYSKDNQEFFKFKQKTFHSLFARKLSLEEINGSVLNLFKNESKLEQRIKYYRIKEIDEAERAFIRNIPIDTEGFLDVEVSANKLFKLSGKKGFNYFRLKIFSGIIITVLILALLYTFRNDIYALTSEDQLKKLLTRDNGDISVVLALPILYGIVGSLFIPLNVYIIIIATLFSLWQSIFIASTSALIASLFHYWLGTVAGFAIFKFFPSKRLQKLKKIVKEPGVFKMGFLRLIPIAPFIMVNIGCGTFKVSLMHYTLGSFLGFLPGIITLSLFQVSLKKLILEPSPLQLFIVVTITILIIIFFIRIRNKIYQRVTGD